MEEALVLTEIGFLGLLLIAVLVAIAVKYIRLPYTIALVLCGLGIGFMGFHSISLSKELILFVFLPPLLFEGAIHIDIDKLRENLTSILLLAVVGLSFGILLVGLLLNSLTGIELIYCLLFGAMIMPTDPISVLALFKKLGVSKRLSMIVEGESLFNDGVGIVLFMVILRVVEASHFSIVETIIEFLMVVLGGLLIGFIAGYSTYRFLRHIDDHLIEVVITGILAYGTFIACESLHVSGVMGVVAAGLLIGNRGTAFAMSPTTRIAIRDSWALTAFMVNSLIFLLIGIQIPIGNILSHPDLMVMITVSILVVLIARALTVYPLLMTLNLKSKRKISFAKMHVINWGGLHGSIPIALLLSLPAIPHLEELSFMVFGVVLFSLVVQGLTMEPLIKMLNLIKIRPEVEKYERILTEKISLQRALNEIKLMRENREIPANLYHELEKQYSVRLGELAEKIHELIEKYPDIRQNQIRYARKRMLLAQKSSIQDSTMKGIASYETGAKLIQKIDAEMEETDDST